MDEPEPGGWLPEATGVDRVGLTVRSLTDQLEFYREAIGLEATRTGDRASLAAGNEPLLSLREDGAAPERSPDAAGLYHVAIRLPDRAALGAALARLRAADVQLDGAADHVASEALYLQDPEGTGIELYADRPRDAWAYTDDGQVRLPGDPLDLSPIEAAAPAEPGGSIDPEAAVGHVHLEVTDLEAATAFYRSLGFHWQLQKPRATFLAGGDYHHHVALNTRQGRTGPYRSECLGLESVRFAVPESALERTRERLATMDWPVTEGADDLRTEDPDGLPLRFRAR